jgi:hypothetical protein
MTPTLFSPFFLFLLGEHIKNWRSRYFILKDDGLFNGFRNKPSTDQELDDPLNNFTVRNCEIIESNRPRPFTFSIRGLQMTTVVVRTFSVESEEERWVGVVKMQLRWSSAVSLVLILRGRLHVQIRVQIGVRFSVRFGAKGGLQSNVGSVFYEMS